MPPFVATSLGATKHRFSSHAAMPLIAPSDPRSTLVRPTSHTTGMMRRPEGIDDCGWHRPVGSWMGRALNGRQHEPDMSK
jgi:hypothetical protein